MSISNQENMKAVRQLLIGEQLITSADANFDFIMPNEFDRIRVRLKSLKPAADAALFMRFKLQGASAVASGASDYAWAYDSVLAGTGAVVATDDADSEIQLALEVGAAANEAASGDIVIDNFYAQSGADALPTVQWDLQVVNGTPGYLKYNGAGFYIAAAAKLVEGRLLFDSQDMADGKIEVYGELLGD